MAISPKQLLEAFQRLGYVVVRDSPNNWLVHIDGKARPFSVPRLGKYVAADVLAAATVYEPNLSP